MMRVYQATGANPPPAESPTSRPENKEAPGFDPELDDDLV